MPRASASLAIVATVACAVLIHVLRRRRRPVHQPLSACDARLVALHALVRRLGATPHAERLILRGSLLLWHYCPALPRPVNDLDFLALFDNDLDLAMQVVRDACAVAQDAADPPVSFALVSASRHWEDMAHPAVKVWLSAHLGDKTLQLAIDFGWGDPLEPPATTIKLRNRLPGARGVPGVQAARPELLLAWKLHGLFERETPGLSTQGVPKGFWRPKDLFDAYLLASAWCEAPLDEHVLARAVNAAFASRGHPVSRLMRLVHGRFGKSAGSCRSYGRWRAALAGEASYRRAGGAAVPESPSACVAELRPLCARVLELLGFRALPGEDLPIAPAEEVEKLCETIRASSAFLPPPPPPAAARTASAARPPDVEAYYVLGGSNPRKWEEVRRILGEQQGLIQPSAYRAPEHLRFPAGLEAGFPAAESAARALALHCYRALGGKPAIVDMIYLDLDGVGAIHRLAVRDRVSGRGRVQTRGALSSPLPTPLPWPTAGEAGAPVLPRPCRPGRHDARPPGTDSGRRGSGTLQWAPGRPRGESGGMAVRGSWAHTASPRFRWTSCGARRHTGGTAASSPMALSAHCRSSGTLRRVRRCRCRPSRHGVRQRAWSHRTLRAVWVHPRTRALVDLLGSFRSHEAYGTMEASRGLYEVHVTVRTPSVAEGGVDSFKGGQGRSSAARRAGGERSLSAPRHSLGHQRPRACSTSRPWSSRTKAAPTLCR